MLPTSQQRLALFGLGVDWYTLEIDRRVSVHFGDSPREEAVDLQRSVEEIIVSQFMARSAADTR